MLSRIVVLAASALFTLAGIAGAQNRLTVTDGQEAADLAARGWLQVDEGIWQRTTAKGTKETFVSGAAGLEKVLPSLRAEQSRLQEAFWADPSEANKRAVDGQVQLVAAVEANLRRPAGVATGGAEASDESLCSRTYSHSASVLSYRCTDNGYAYASYSTSDPVACPEQCTVHAYAYVSAQCLDGNRRVDSDSCSQTGTNVTCSAVATEFFGDTCYQYAFASIHCPELNNLYLSQSDSNSACECSC